MVGIKKSKYTKYLYKLGLLSMLCILLISLSTGCQDKRQQVIQQRYTVAKDFVHLAFDYTPGTSLYDADDKLKAMTTSSIYNSRFNLSDNKIFDRYYGVGTTKRSVVISKFGVTEDTDSSTGFIVVMQYKTEYNLQSNQSESYAQPKTVYVKVDNKNKVIAFKDYNDYTEDQ